MATPFVAESSDIEQLDALQLTLLLRALLNAEAFATGIALRSVEVALNITVGDGGEDGHIRWSGDPDSTDFVPNRNTCFQCKATQLSAAEYAVEIRTKDGTIKPMVESTLNNGGAYVVFTSQLLNGQGKKDRITSLRKALADAGKPYSESCILEIYDAEQIATWATLHLSAFCLLAQWNGRAEARSLKNYDLWGKFEIFSQLPFLSAPSRAPIIDALKAGLLEERASFRLTGLSGLGKTRTAYQVFVEEEALRGSVVYLDASTEPHIAGIITGWCTERKRAIVVVDNCEGLLHEKIAQEVRRSDSRLSLLTLDYHNDKVEKPTHPLQLKPLKADELLALLQSAYKSQVPDLERIVAFAQGFPQMAVLLVSARINEDPEMGYLSEDTLANRLLWLRHETPDPKRLAILQACSLFDFFGMEGDVETHLQFISEVAGEDINLAFRCLKDFIARGIVDKRGRFAQIVPKPLAMRLAGQWWSNTRLAQQESFVEMLPKELIESFCSQIEKMDFHSEVKQLTEKLCGHQGPFGQAEEILTDRGSRLFRSLAHVNPTATSQALARAIHGLNHDAVLAVAGHVRRNLVWALEHLCYHEELFEESAWSLLLLAASENETWGNNATGQFKQLFNTHLSGTEAPPAMRLSLIERAFGLGREDIDIVAIEALAQAISLLGRSRTVGAEFQGMKAPLQEWAPATWGDIFAYWDGVLDLLMSCLNRGSKQRNLVKKKIGESIRPLFNRGRFEKLESIITAVVANTGVFWPEAKESLTTILHHDLSSAPPIAKDAAQRWMAILSPINATLAEQIKILVINPPWEHKENGEGKYVDVSAEKAKGLARNNSANISELIDNIDILASQACKQAYVFGRELALTSEKPLALIDAALQRIRELPEPNIGFSLGLMAGLHIRSLSDWKRHLEMISNDDKIVVSYIPFASTGIILAKHLQHILDLIRRGRIQPQAANHLMYGSVLDHLLPETIADFCLELGEFSTSGAWPALNVLFMYSHPSRSKILSIRPQAKVIILRVPLDSEYSNGNKDIYHWSELVNWVLPTHDPEFVTLLMKQLLKACRKGLDHSDIWHYFKPTLTSAFKSNGAIAWPILASAMLSETGMNKYWIRELIESENGNALNHPGALSALPPESVIAWCRENPDVGAPFVASCISILEETGGVKSPTPLLLELLSNFGDNEKVTRALTAALHSRGWSGSLVPYLKADKTAIEPLTKHSNVHVRKWSTDVISLLDKEIARESERDEEEDLRFR